MRLHVKLFAFLLCLCVISPALATPVSRDDARTVAANWIALMTANKGNWCGEKHARINDVTEIKRKGRTIGYFCSVWPAGYIVVSAYKELAPVKAYCEDEDIDPASNTEMAGFLKDSLEHNCDSIERKFGKARMTDPKGLRAAPAVDYRKSWAQLGAKVDGLATQSITPQTGYEGGHVLVSTEWHQNDPYNQQCPPGDGCAHTIVGCTGTATAQIMRYWNWPPYGVGSPYTDSYDWANMLDSYAPGTWNNPTATQKSAVAELSYEAALAADTDFGCDGSSADFSDARDGFRDHLRFYATRVDRDDYTADGWFSYIKSQLSDCNMPMEYRIKASDIGHVIVCDGWEEVGSPPSRYMHINYGWPDQYYSAWYELDDPALGPLDEQIMLVYVYPQVGLVSTDLLSSYPRDASFPYRYVTRDIANSPYQSTAFAAGQNIQFLPGVTLSGAGSSSVGATIYGSTSNVTRLYTEANASKGIRIDNGAIRLSNNGGVSIKPFGRPTHVRVWNKSTPQQYQVYVHWDHGIGDRDGFTIQKQTSDWPIWADLATVGPDEEAYWDFDIQPWVWHAYRIRSFKGQAVSDWSDTKDVFVLVENAPTGG